MQARVIALAREAGFAECFVLPIPVFPHYERRRQDGALHSGGRELISRPGETFPWANALLLLIYAYRPYPRGAVMAGNYPYNHASYLAAKALADLLNGEGVRAERCYVPFRELAMENGIGITLKNGMMAIPPYGTRFAVQMLAVALERPAYRLPSPTRTCADCGACARACPVGAITAEGFDFRRCIRAYMGREPMPDWVMDHLETLLGCDRCQFACPMNAGLPENPDVPAAFDPARIVAGEQKEALLLVGTNMKTGGCLIAQAAVLLAKRDGEAALPALEPLLMDPRDAVRTAAEYAISLLRKPGNRGTIEHTISDLPR